MNRTGDIRINLLNYKMEGKFKRQRVFKLLGLMVLSLILIAGVAYYLMAEKKAELASLQQINQDLKEELSEGGSVAVYLTNDAIAGQIKAKQETISHLVDKQIVYSGALKELDELVPAGILVISIDVKAGHLSLKGYALSNSDLIDFLQSLKDDPFFLNISDLKSQRNDESGEVSFDLLLGWKEVTEE